MSPCEGHGMVGSNTLKGVLYCLSLDKVKLRDTTAAVNVLLYHMPQLHSTTDFCFGLSYIGMKFLRQLTIINLYRKNLWGK
jgi:hypothetical protein